MQRNSPWPGFYVDGDENEPDLRYEIKMIYMAMSVKILICYGLIWNLYFPIFETERSRPINETLEIYAYRGKLESDSEIRQFATHSNF